MSAIKTMEKKGSRKSAKQQKSLGYSQFQIKQ